MADGSHNIYPPGLTCTSYQKTYSYPILMDDGSNLSLADWKAIGTPMITGFRLQYSNSSSDLTSGISLLDNNDAYYHSGGNNVVWQDDPTAISGTSSLSNPTRGDFQWVGISARWVRLVAFHGVVSGSPTMSGTSYIK